MLLLYLLKTLMISGLLLGYYWLFLRNRPCHRFNRYFLMAIPAISLILPGLRLAIPSFWPQSAAVNPVQLLGVANGGWEETVTIYARQGFWKSIPWESLCLISGLLVSVCFLIRFYRSLLYLRSLRRNNPHSELQGAHIYFIRDKGTPFSFFTSIFWNESQELCSSTSQQILRHELYHVQHIHSLDIVLLEITRIFCWFNPFLHIIRQEVQVLHEFLADAYAASGGDRLSYAELLLANSMRPVSFQIAHPFFQNHIKRRIAMMIPNKKINSGLLSRIMLFPVVVLILALFAFRFQKQADLLLHRPAMIRVVVDAGHGGIDYGVTVNGRTEKDINLAIAGKIRQLSKQYNVDVIMTRENDELPGSVSNIRDGLIFRTGLAVKENADLFISIHTGGDKSDDAPEGFDIYVPESTSTVYPGSVKLGSSITEFIRKDFPIASELKQQSKPAILILSRATVPAILIECGNLYKKSDFDFITENTNQDKIARDILEGIRKYALKSTGFVDPSSMPPDTLSSEKLEKLEANSISSITVDKAKNRIYVKFKNGKEAIVIVTEDMKKAWDTSGAFKKVEFEAEFPGGASAWLQFLIKNLKYPENAAMHELEGDVPVEFIVEKDGRVTHVRAQGGPQELRAEAERVVSASGKWIPAKNHGKIVRSYKIQPIDFRLKSS